MIPKRFRDQLGLKPGDEVEFTLEDQGVRVEPIRESLPLKGRFSDLPVPLTRLLEDEHRREIEAGR